MKKHDRPEWQMPQLIESCRPDIVDWFDQLARDATEALAGLDELALDKATAGGVVSNVLELIDPVSTPESSIAAYRRAAFAWSMIDEIVSDYAPVARALAFGEVSDRVNPERDLYARIEKLSTYRGAPHALMFDADSMALLAFDLNPVEAVASGNGRIAPLADPLGSDFAELKRRLDVLNGAYSWLELRKLHNGDKTTATVGIAGTHSRMRVFPAGQNYSPHARAGATSAAASLELFKAERPELFEPLDSGDYEIDAVDDAQ